MSGKFRFRLAELEASKDNAVLQRKLEMTCDRLDKMLSKSNKKQQQSLEACVVKTYDLLEEAENHEKTKLEETNKDTSTTTEERDLPDKTDKQNIPCASVRGTLKSPMRPKTAPACVLKSSRDRTTKTFSGKPMTSRYRSASFPFANQRDKHNKSDDLEALGGAAARKEEFLNEYFDKYRWAFMSKQFQTKNPQKGKQQKPKVSSMNKAAMRAESDRSIRIAKRHIRKSAYLRDKIYRDTVAAVESLDITLCDSD